MPRKPLKVVAQMECVGYRGKPAIRLVFHKIHNNTMSRLFDAFDADFEEGFGVIIEELPLPVKGKLSWRSCAFIVPLAQGALPRPGKRMAILAELKFELSVKKYPARVILICEQLRWKTEERLARSFGAVDRGMARSNQVGWQYGEKHRGRRKVVFSVPLPKRAASAA